MTDDSTVPPDGHQDADEKLDTDSALFDQPDGTDWYLATIVDLATVLGVQQVVTLTVGGTLISGRVISARLYFENLSELLGQGTVTGLEDGQSLLPQLTQLQTRYKDMFPAAGAKGQQLGSQRYGYIHLDNVMVMGPNGTIDLKPGLWRGKLSSVDGFVLGAHFT